MNIKIKRAIEELPEDKQEYMLSMLSHLYKNLYLTDLQIQGIKNGLNIYLLI